MAAARADVLVPAEPADGVQVAAGVFGGARRSTGRHGRQGGSGGAGRGGGHWRAVCAVNAVFMNHGFQGVRVGFISHDVVDDLADRVAVFTEGVIQLSRLQVFVKHLALVLMLVGLVGVLRLRGAAVALPLQHVADDDSDQAQQEEDGHQGECREVVCPTIVLVSHCGIIRRPDGGVGHGGTEGPQR